jgi:hypothetical protein
MDNAPQPVSVWTIAGGILLALLIWRTLNVIESQIAIRQFNAQMAQIRKDWPAPKMRTANMATKNPPQAPPAIEARDIPLREGERCIRGKRFARLTNGWEQTGTCNRSTPR